MAFPKGDRFVILRSGMSKSDLDSGEPFQEPMSYAPGATTCWNDCWRRIFDQFGQAILAYARRRGLSDHSAEDVLQEVMTALIRYQHGLEPGPCRDRGSFQAWLWGVIKNRLRSVRRSDEKEPTLPIAGSLQGETQENRCMPPDGSEMPPDRAELEEREWHRAMLAAAMKKVQDRVSSTNFAIYQALLEEKASAVELATVHAMKPNAIYQVKARCEEMIIREAQTMRQAWDDLRCPTHLK